MSVHTHISVSCGTKSNDLLRATSERQGLIISVLTWTPSLDKSSTVLSVDPVSKTYISFKSMSVKPSFKISKI